MTYQTNNPVGSVDVRDLYDNAEAFDNFSAGPLDAYPDRLGVMRQSLQGIRNASQYVILGPYASGLEFTAMNQIFSYLGEFYAPGPSITLPYTTTGVGAAEIANFRSVGDAVLRSDLAGAGGAQLVEYRGRTVYDRLGDVVSVKDFGAVGDGVANDTAAVQAALTAGAGKTVSFPPATYKLTALTVPANTTIIATGATLDFSAAGDITALTFGAGVSMQGGKIQGPGGATFQNSGIAILAGGTPNHPAAPSYVEAPKIDGVWIDGFANTGIQLQYCKDGHVKNCRITDMGYAAVFGISVHRVDITGNRIDIVGGVGAPDSYGITVSHWDAYSLTSGPSSSNCHIADNTISNVAWEAIDTHSGSSLIINGNIIYSCRYGIAVVAGDTLGVAERGSQDVVVANNQISGIGTGSSIQVQGASAQLAGSISITGNLCIDGGTVDNVNEGAIRIQLCYAVTVANNAIRNPYVYGVNVVGTSIGLEISGNNISNPQGTAMQFPACVAVLSSNVSATIQGNTFARLGAIGTYTGVLSVGVAGALTGLDINIGQNTFLGITSSLLQLSLATTAGVVVSGLATQKGQGSAVLLATGNALLTVNYAKAFAGVPKVMLTRNGTPLPGDVAKPPIMEISTITNAGFTAVIRPHDLTAFGGTGTLFVDWVATL